MLKFTPAEETRLRHAVQYYINSLKKDIYLSQNPDYIKMCYSDLLAHEEILRKIEIG